MGVTDTQLYFAVGVPVLAILVSMGLNLIQIIGIRDDIKQIRDDIRQLRGDVNILTGKVYEGR